MHLGSPPSRQTATSTRIPQPNGDQLFSFANRRFSRFSVDHKVYCVPVDNTEQVWIERLDEVLRRFFHRDRDVFAPFPPGPDSDEDDDDSESLPAVLDCGFGGGAWIDRVLDDYQGNLDVTGIDIYLGAREDDENGNGDTANGASIPIDPVQEFVRKRWNLNAPFREDRSPERLTPETFDLINSRYLADGINTDRWSSYVRELKHLLKPGAWLQMVEIQLPVQDSSGRLPEGSALARWYQWYSWALQQMNKNVRVGRELGQIMEAQGFVNVRAAPRDLKIGDWDPSQAVIGGRTRAIIEQMLMSLSVYPFLSRDIGRMNEDNYRNLIAAAVAELRNPQFKLYFRVYVAIGQRPLSR